MHSIDPLMISIMPIILSFLLFTIGWQAALADSQGRYFLMISLFSILGFIGASVITNIRRRI